MAMDYSLADIANATNHEHNDGFMGFFWIFALLILAGGGLGGLGLGNKGDFSQYATAASQNEILLGQQFQTLGANVNKVGDGIASLGYAQSNQITTEGRAIQQQISNCCCENQRNTDALRYDVSQMIAQTNANVTAQTQKVLDQLCTNRMAEMQQQINNLQLQNAIAGVVKYPQASTYTAGENPFCAPACTNAF